MRRHIEATGLLLIEVPDAELNPFDIVVADHASHFSKTTISAVVRSAGYEVIACGNLVVPKEITLLARPLHQARSAGRELADQGAAPFAQRNLTWLEDTLNRARALAGDPEIVLADEPTAALDTKTALSVMELLRELASSHGRAVVVVTHDPRLERFADRVVRVEDGRISSIEGKSS